jgi:polar amino acid transport system substrate-binding protein
MRWAAGILAVFIFSGAAGAQERILRLATEGAYPPFNAVTPAGTLEGFDIDIGNALCAEMRFKCEWVVQDWDGMIPALQAAKFDAIVASMFITEERKQQVDFTDRYYSTPPAVIVRKDSEIDGATPADLKGRSVGVQGGSVYAIYAESLLGRIDAINDDLLVLDQFLKSTEGACCRLAGEIAPILSIHGPGAGIAVRRGDPILAQFNAALERIQAKGVYKSINDRYFSFNISGAPN